MATIETQIEKIERLKLFVVNDLPTYALEVAAKDLTALVANRVVQTGVNYVGTPFSPYSTSQISAVRFIGKSRTQSAERKIQQKVKSRTALSYSEFRDINNLNSDKKNFEFFGEMWRKFGVVKVQNIGGKFTIGIGGTTKESQKKIDENSRREGYSIIENSDSEALLIQKTTQDWFNLKAKEILQTL